MPTRAIALFGILCLVGIVLLTVTVGAGPLPIDLSVRSALGVTEGSAVPLPLQVLNAIGGALVWDAGVALLVAALVLKGERGVGLWIAFGVLAGEALSTGLKLIVDRPRPPGIAVVDLVTQASFPSGHVTRSAITCALLVLFWRGGRGARIGLASVAVVVAALMGLARIVSGEHWPTDVLGAYLLSGIVVLGVAAASAQTGIREKELVPPPLPAPGSPGVPRRP